MASGNEGGRREIVFALLYRQVHGWMMPPRCHKVVDECLAALRRSSEKVYLVDDTLGKS